MASKWIWPFELMEKLGEGGMGVVYRARYVGNNRIVAVKLLPDEIAQNATLTARFERELEILQQLKHPNIVNCFGGVCESQQRFYAMELVEGGTLSDLLKKKGRLSWDYVIEYGLQMCAGLEHAHEHGVVHRDVKPGNFLVTKQGQIKLSDFGLATMVAGAKITKAGKTAGTFMYMAPEQIRGKPPVTNRTDLYAMGCVLYELLTGAPPFDGETPAEVLHKHLKEPPPRVATKMFDCPPALDQLITDLLQKDAEARPASAAEVSNRLKSVLRPSLTNVDQYSRTPLATVSVAVGAAKLESESDSDAFYDRRRGQPWPWIAATVVMTVLALVGWWQSWSQSRQWSALESRWLAAAQTGITNDRVAAIYRLSDLKPWTRSRSAALAPLLQDPEPLIRTEVLRAYTRHPEVSAGQLGTVMKLAARDEHLEVRSLATTTEKMLKETRQTGSGWGWLVFLLVILASCGAGSWWVWKSSLRRELPVRTATT